MISYSKFKNSGDFYNSTNNKLIAPNERFGNGARIYEVDDLFSSEIYKMEKKKGISDGF